MGYFLVGGFSAKVVTNHFCEFQCAYVKIYCGDACSEFISLSP